MAKKTVTSPAKTLTREDLIKVGKNFLTFVAPTLAIFFGQLAMGVTFGKAWPIAAFAFYQTLSDLFSKWSASSTYTVK